MQSDQQTDLLHQIRQIVAEEVQEALQKKEVRNSIVVYGVPEEDQGETVSKILDFANLFRDNYTVKYRLGKPIPGKIRPLRVDLREGIPVPSMRDLARKLSSDTSLRSFHVRLMETSRQRREGFLAREERRKEKLEKEEMQEMEKLKKEEMKEKQLEKVKTEEQKQSIQPEQAKSVPEEKEIPLATNKLYNPKRKKKRRSKQVKSKNTDTPKEPDQTEERRPDGCKQQ